jgi:endonuclease/exonuclease/phosphatase family metal-dependent hydrolase
MALRPSSLANWRALNEHLGPDCLRIASYNIHGCIGSDGREDAWRIARVIEEMGCDTVGLQEVNTRADGQHASMQLDYLADATNMEPVPGLTILRHDGHFGNALLTRRRVLAVRRHELAYSGREPRNALDVDLDACGTTVRVIVTHLGLMPVERRFQVRKILSLVRATPIDEHLMVLGDINEWLPLGRPLRWMHALFGRSPAERSFPSRWPLFALDRVWVRPRHALLAFGVHRSSLAVEASDHLPVKAIVTGTEEKKRGQDRFSAEPARFSQSEKRVLTP